LTNEVHDALLEHARDGTPEEVCGVLGGRCGSDTRVESVHRVPNVASQPRVEYVIDPEAQLDVMEDIETSGEAVVGFYHSHPDGPNEPSETDVTRATWPGFYYLIVSLPGQTVGTWHWDGERFEREEIRVLSRR
ncbi:MAG TPA: desampylase, partial [Halococcus sp.]|nr:desampylase [Halococcus sp.]